MTTATHFRENAKQAAIDQWTADPCGPAVEGTPGTRAYFERLLGERLAYGRWMPEALDYAGARGRPVLDVGCGQGIDLALYAQAGAHPTGVDLTPRHVELAQAHLAAMNLDGEVLRGDGEALPFPDETFDRVSSNGVLHHTPDILAALTEIRRVLRPAGRATVIVYNFWSLHFWLHQVLGEGIARGKLLRERSMEGVMSTSVEWSTVDARPLVRVYSGRAMRRLFREAGFGEVETLVRHFRATDTIPTKLLAPHLRTLRDPRVLDRIGRAAGWYVVARGARED